MAVILAPQSKAACEVPTQFITGSLACTWTVLSSQPSLPVKAQCDATNNDKRI